MADLNSGSRLSIAKLILVPAIITLGVTLLRLAGELEHWNKLLFNSSAGGGGAIIGISWLPIIFGPYFALKLAGQGEGSKGTGKMLGMIAVGIVCFVGGGFVGYAAQVTFPGHLVVGLAVMAAGALAPLLAWPALVKTLLAYAYSARIPVAILMFFALRGQWGTHYDAIAPGFPADMSFGAKYLQLALIPQLIFWIAYTVLLGALLGTIIAAFARRGKTSKPATS